MNKPPYVAGYNIEIPFMFHDLKNLDQIYGETSRHSLLGNCGLQLILGANDLANFKTTYVHLGSRFADSLYQRFVPPTGSRSNIFYLSIHDGRDAAGNPSLGPTLGHPGAKLGAPNPNHLELDRGDSA